jgi:hypothetical protein
MHATGTSPDWVVMTFVAESQLIRCGSDIGIGYPKRSIISSYSELISENCCYMKSGHESICTI